MAAKKKAAKTAKEGAKRSAKKSAAKAPKRNVKSAGAKKATVRSRVRDEPVPSIMGGSDGDE